MTDSPAIQDDFADLLRELNAARAEYLVVGGYAFSHHVRPRATKVLDVVVRPTSENSHRVFAALAAFGAPLRSDGVGREDFAQAGLVYQLGRSPRRIDVLTALTGVDFDAAWKNSELGNFGPVATRFLSPADLARNKRAVGRPQDLADVAALEKKFPQLRITADPATNSPGRKRRRR